MDEVEAMKSIATALDKLEPGERTRVLDWAVAKYHGGKNVSNFIADGSAKAEKNASGSPSKPKPSKKPKIILSMDKTLNLAPPGKESAIQFAVKKGPSNANHKCVTAVYYLKHALDLPKVSAQGVLTFFKTVGWPTPADLKNKLQQAGTAGWLDTANSEDIKLTSSGENLVEHKLAGKTK